MIMLERDYDGVFGDLYVDDDIRGDGHIYYGDELDLDYTNGIMSAIIWADVKYYDDFSDSYVTDNFDFEVKNDGMRNSEFKEYVRDNVRDILKRKCEIEGFKLIRPTEVEWRHFDDTDDTTEPIK